MAPSEHFTQLVNRAAAGDDRAAGEVLPRIVDELRRLAVARMRNLPAGQTLQPTALVNEVWLRLAENHDSPWQGRRHFYFVAARAMRDILVENARRKAAGKRGGDRQRVELEEQHLVIQAPVDDVLALERALLRLDKIDPLGSKIVQLRFFIGLEQQEIADALEISLSSVERKWRFIRTWLKNELSGDEALGA